MSTKQDKKTSVNQRIVIGDAVRAKEQSGKFLCIGGKYAGHWFADAPKGYRLTRLLEADGYYFFCALDMTLEDVWYSLITAYWLQHNGKKKPGIIDKILDGAAQFNQYSRNPATRCYLGRDEMDELSSDIMSTMAPDAIVSINNNNDKRYFEGMEIIALPTLSHISFGVDPDEV